MRVELRDGQWAELRERITHAEDKAMKKAYVTGEPGAAFDVPTIALRIFIRDWNVKDPDGKPITLSDADAIDRLPTDIADDLWDRASDLYRGATEPDASYARLIAWLAASGKVSGSEVDKLPDPDLFHDALLLHQSGTWSPDDLDEMDALLLAVMRKFRSVTTTRGVT